MSRRKKELSGDYEVGYGRPPKHSQFKTGEKQDHRRSRRIGHDLGAHILDELGHQMTFTEDGRRRKMPKMKVLAKQMVNQALKTGDPRRLENYLPKPTGEAEEPFTDAELETIARFLAQFPRKTEEGA